MFLQLCVCLYSTALLLRTSAAAGRGAGRAFPIDSENYVMDSFARINPSIEWDYTNFLIDLAGTFANCDATKASGRSFDTNTLTPEGETVSGVVDWTDGAGADVDAVNEYIKTIIDRWTTERRYNRLIEGARTFGCSIRPGCRGAAVVSCLFSPGGDSSQNDQGGEDGQQDQPEKLTSLYAVAFTPEQYEVVEQYTGNVSLTTDQTVQQYTTVIFHSYRIVTQVFSLRTFTGSAAYDQQYLKQQLDSKCDGLNECAAIIKIKKWDRSHFLENLSGRETNCAMIDTESWPFVQLRQAEIDYAMRVSAEYGSAENLGSTQEAIERILPTFKQVKNAQKLGCSLIPDCVANNRMYVVVSCLYEE